MTLTERAAALTPVLRERAPAAEQARRVADATYDLLAEAGVFRMTAPRRHGGAEADFQTQADVLAALARGCLSTSWVATIYSAMSWLAGTFPDEAQQEIFEGADPRMSGVFSPTGTGVPRDGGLVVTGRWPFNTGCHGARWTGLHVIVGEGDRAVPTFVIARSRDLTILDDWHASGMAATGSNTVVADQVFVPAHRCRPLPDLLEARPVARHNADDAYFALPLAAVLVVNAGGAPLGAARGALDSFLERLPGRGISYTFYDDKAAAPVTHLQLAEASLTIDSADAHVRMANALLDGPVAGLMSVEARVRSRAHVSFATGLARHAVDTLFYASGASSIQTQVPIQRVQRDIQALANHAIMHTQTGLELYGRILLGLAPNTPIY